MVETNEQKSIADSLARSLNSSTGNPRKANRKRGGKATIVTDRTVSFCREAGGVPRMQNRCVARERPCLTNNTMRDLHCRGRGNRAEIQNIVPNQLFEARSGMTPSFCKKLQAFAPARPMISGQGRLQAVVRK